MSLTSSSTSESMDMIPGFLNFSEILQKVINSYIWREVQNDFNSCSRILNVGNGGNLAVCDTCNLEIIIKVLALV